MLTHCLWLAVRLPLLLGLTLLLNVAHAEFGYVARYRRSTGQPDQTLNGNGYIVGSALQGYNQSVAIDASGRIVVAGNLLNGGFLVGRFNPDGSPDSTFGYGGLASVDAVHNVEVHGVGVDSSQRVYIVADGADSSTFSYVARFTASGALDTKTYGANTQTPGYVRLANITSTALDVASDGTVAAVTYGATHGFTYVLLDPTGLIRFNKFDAFDRSAADHGSFELGQSVRLDANGRMIVVGESATGKMGVVRYNTLGTRDSSFNHGAPLLLSFGYDQQRATDVDLDGSGRIVIVGTSFTNTTQAHFLLVRLNDSGMIDRQADFNRGSSSSTAVGALPSLACAGDIYFVSSAYALDANHPQNSLFKLSADTFDFVTSFAHSGWMHDGVPGFNFSSPLGLAIDQNANPVMVGVVDNR